MSELIKTILYTGVGAVSVVTEKFAHFINELIREGKISTEDGRKLIDEFVKNTETKKDEFETQLTHIVERVIKSMNLATNRELQELRSRIEELEHNTVAPISNEPKALKAAKTVK